MLELEEFEWPHDEEEFFIEDWFVHQPTQG
jgi:hypothetical protein